MTSKPGISFHLLNSDQLDQIRPLWEALRDFHTTVPNRFASTIAGRPFEPRRDELREKAAKGRLRIEVAAAQTNDQAAADSPAEEMFVAYCVTSLSVTGAGEVESLYVAPEYRRQGIAGRLVRSALDWLAEHGAKTRRVIVFDGNDEALAFYARIGFHPRSLELEL
jgi:ribosomal protein S18 acetylase RimI-like enzyme